MSMTVAGKASPKATKIARSIEAKVTKDLTVLRSGGGGLSGVHTLERFILDAFGEGFRVMIRRTQQGSPEGAIVTEGATGATIQYRVGGPGAQ